MKHTGLKLKYFPSVSAEDEPCFDISEDLGGGNFGYVAEVFDEEKAGFIVKAVNNHESLLEALKYMVDNIGQPNSLETRDGFNESRAAIKQAEKE